MPASPSMKQMDDSAATIPSRPAPVTAMFCPVYAPV
jgi:hypothetical protein